MLDLGASEHADLAGDPAEGLVAELTAHAPEDGAPAHAAAEILRRSAAGETPIGLYRLSEVLAPATASVPAQRVPAGEADGLVDVVRRYPCAVLDASDPARVAENLAAVLVDGKRVLVSGADPAALSAVRAALPESLHGVCLDAPPPLSDAELRELRSLLVTVTPSRQLRLHQALPHPNLVPDADRVAALCRAAGGKGYPPRDTVDLLPELLGGLHEDRLSALLETARRCEDTLRAMDPARDSLWTSALLERVLFGSDREEFDALLRHTTDVVLSADKLRDAGDQMAVVGTLPPDAIEQLRAYVRYLDGGGRARVYFRSAQQRAVQPVLRHLRLDGASLKDTTVLHQALAFVELIEAMDGIGERCRRLRVPEPRNVPGVVELNRQLDRIEEAARAAEHLRHEVLFIHPDSPVTVPDLATIEQVARTIVESGGASGMSTARAQLGRLAERLARSMPASDAAPEFGVLLSALHARNLPAYQDALAALAAARREYADQRRQVELLGRLRSAVPELAELWEQSGPQRFTQGTARFVPLDELLGQLPDADTADLVLLLGAGSLGTENLLVAAAAPRLLAVSAGFAGTPPPGPAGSDDTVLSRLRRAGVPVIVAGGDGASAPIEPVAVAEEAPAAPPAPVAYVEMPAPPAGVDEVPPPPLDDAALAEDTLADKVLDGGRSDGGRSDGGRSGSAGAEPAHERRPEVPAPRSDSPDVSTGSSGADKVDGPTLPFTVPAQREAPPQEANPSKKRAAARVGAEQVETSEPPEVETEYVVLPLGIVARAVEPRADRAADDQRAGA
ncbi:MAG TPA: hypothetical protein VH008_11180 [Pseudonocardia sp.]|nr:hypothetical protein [Pseudonocardia sp.]